MTLRKAVFLFHTPSLVYSISLTRLATRIGLYLAPPQPSVDMVSSTPGANSKKIKFLIGCHVKSLEIPPPSIWFVQTNFLGVSTVLPLP